MIDAGNLGPWTFGNNATVNGTFFLTLFANGSPELNRVSLISNGAGTMVLRFHWLL